MNRILAVLVLVAAATSAVAQGSGHTGHGHTGHGHAGQGHAGHSNYAGMERREIKALSAERIADLRAGRGLGFALAAELNGYPGPLHVLELAEPLELTAEQRQQMEALFAQMKADAIRLGEQLIESERALDALFAERMATADTVARASARSAQLEGELRTTHLKYHLTTVDVLSHGQIARYNRLRGYDVDPPR